MGLKTTKSIKEISEQIALDSTRSYYDEKVLSKIHEAASQGYFDCDVDLTNYTDAMLRHLKNDGFETQHISKNNSNNRYFYKIIW